MFIHYQRVTSPKPVPSVLLLCREGSIVSVCGAASAHPSRSHQLHSALGRCSAPCMVSAWGHPKALLWIPTPVQVQPVQCSGWAWGCFQWAESEFELQFWWEFRSLLHWHTLKLRRLSTALHPGWSVPTGETTASCKWDIFSCSFKNAFKHTQGWNQTAIK